MIKTRILIVEDERITAEDLKNTLLAQGYEISGVASSESSFYKIIETDMPDLVLMDIFIKGNKDGIELATEIKEKYHIPVIYLTAFSDGPILERAKISEPFGYILKPFQERELQSNIEMALHKNRMEKRIIHLNAILKAIRDINQLIVRVDNPKDLVQKTCTTLLSTRAYTGAWFLRVDKDNKYLDAASAGSNIELDKLTEMVQKGEWPECLKNLNKTDQTVFSTIDNSVECNPCKVGKNCTSQGTLVSKVSYQSRLFGYLAVSMPDALVTDDEELELFKEISEDLGLALSNLEHKFMKEQAEELLRISEERFRALYENTPLSYQSLDDNGYFLDVNPVWEQTLGYKKEEIVGKWFGYILHPDHIDYFKKSYPDFKKKGEVHNIQFKLRKKSGGYLQVSFEGRIGYNTDGSFRQTYCVFKDITVQKKAEEALFVSETRFRHAFDFAATSMGILSVEGAFLRCNDTFCKLLGYSEAALKKMHFNDITHPEDLHIGLEILQQLSSGKIEKAAFEKRYISKNNDVIYAFVSVSIVYDDANQPQFLITHLVDLTKRRIAEQNLIDSEEQYRTFMNSTNDIAYLKDEKLRYIMINKVQQEFFGTPAEKIIGKTDAELMDKINAGNCMKTDLSVLETMKMQVTIEKFGTKLFETRKFPVRLKGGKKGVGAFIRDVTEQSENEEAIRQKTAEIERFNKLLVGRELKMIELKKEINSLLTLAGNKEKYKIVE